MYRVRVFEHLHEQIEQRIVQFSSSSSSCPNHYQAGLDEKTSYPNSLSGHAPQMRNSSVQSPANIPFFGLLIENLSSAGAVAEEAQIVRVSV